MNDVNEFANLAVLASKAQGGFSVSASVKRPRKVAAVAETAAFGDPAEGAGDETPLEDELEIVKRSPEYFQAQFDDLARCRKILDASLEPLQTKFYGFMVTQSDAIRAMATCTIDMVDSLPLSNVGLVQFIDGLEDACKKRGVPLSDDLARYRKGIVGY